ncbi:EboA domain-containing protein [Schlesneria sp. T3-172]|uniref:EboA domain-containing protein n=1 Tax=Schlesneria sphaerica TaxID=3373610 RepID=UPI0037CC808F
MNPDTEKIRQLIERWMEMRVDPAAAAWIRDRQEVIQQGDKRGLFLAFGMVPRKVGKSDLELTDEELIIGNEVRPGWNPKGWSIDQATRTLFLLTLPPTEPTTLVGILDQLASTGEVGELVAIYQSLPLLPHPEAHVLRAAEGIRTNIKAVFCAVAYQNPYPAEQFNEDQWNQMVLKCQFIGVPMAPVVGLDQRSNAALSGMVLDYIAERWAAHRTIAPELWRCVGRHADPRGLSELHNVLTTGSLVEKYAAGLALSESTEPAAQNFLGIAPEIAGEIASGKITWATIDAMSSC